MEGNFCYGDLFIEKNWCVKKTSRHSDSIKVVQANLTEEAAYELASSLMKIEPDTMSVTYYPTKM